eukprot:scaffold119022_cov57-Phaeocystis_antarctica.AAC.2
MGTPSALAPIAGGVKSLGRSHYHKQPRPSATPLRKTVSTKGSVCLPKLPTRSRLSRHSSPTTMGSRRYDSRTTTFSPEGRLYQVEYAMEAISHAGTAIGILGTDGVVLAAEKKVSSKLLEPAKSSEKMYMIDDHVACAVAGITADANILINQARLHAQRYMFSYQEPQPVEQLVQRLCDEKQLYTQYGGLRPFGVSLLYAGWDKTWGFQLYASDPSGNYGGWKATSIGSNSVAAQSLMKQEYKADAISLDEALKLAIK